MRLDDLKDKDLVLHVYNLIVNGFEGDNRTDLATRPYTHILNRNSCQSCQEIVREVLVAQ
jgi:hypothetical protein